MIKIADARINSFASEQADFVRPSEQVFVLMGEQLQEIIKSAIVKAAEPLLARIETIETELEMRAHAHAAKMESLITRIETLENIKVQPRQRDNGDLLKALIAANGGKMLAIEARKKMHLDKSTFSRLIKTVNDIEIESYKGDKRKIWLKIS